MRRSTRDRRNAARAAEVADRPRQVVCQWNRAEVGDVEHFARLLDHRLEVLAAARLRVKIARGTGRGVAEAYAWRQERERKMREARAALTRARAREAVAA